MLRGPRAARRTSPSRRPRSWSCRGQGHAHHDRDTNCGITIPLRGAAMIELEVPGGDRADGRGRPVRRRAARRGVRDRAVGVNLMDLERHARRRIKERGAEAATGTTPRRSARARSATCSACRSTTPCCTACRTTTCCATVTCSASTSRSARRLGRRLRALGHRRHPRPGGPETDQRQRGALDAAIAAARPGGKIGDISAAIGDVARRTATASTSSSAATASAAPCTRPRTSPTTAAPAAASSSSPA